MDSTIQIRELVAKVKKKETLAMKALYTKYCKSMLNTSIRITNNLQDSEDILQESFLKSFLEINKLKEPSRYGEWLKRIVVNNSLNAVQKKIAFKEIDQVFNSGIEMEDVELRIAIEELSTLIRELPEGCRQILTLFAIENYKHSEISAMMNISLSTSKSQYRYALRLLRDKIMKTQYYD